MADRASNRLLDLTDLETPPFRGPIEEMEHLCAREEISYLHPSKRWEYPWALQRAKLTAGMRVLDAGCGASIFPVYLASLGMEVTAVDLCPPCGLAAAHGVQVNYLSADLGGLPFGDESFDAVFCVSVIEHLPLSGVPRALGELRRVLRPGGRLLLTTDYARDATETMWYEGPGDPFPVDWQVFDEGRLRGTLLEAPGLRMEGDLDLFADWDQIIPSMRRFHGYPYTSVGVALVRE